MPDEREPDERESDDAVFAPLPTELRPPDDMPAPTPQISGDERITGLWALCDFRQVPSVGDPSVHFSVTEHCTLDDGRTVRLRDLGFTVSATRCPEAGTTEPDPMTGLTLESLTDLVLGTTGPAVRPDGSVVDAEHDWDEIAMFARDIGLDTTGEELEAVGYTISVADRVVQRLPES